MSTAPPARAPLGSPLLLASIPLLAAAFQWLQPAGGCPPGYHAFADQRGCFGIPNFGDVVSNIAFFVVGIIGLRSWCRRPPTTARYSWLAFFLGVTAVGFGSAYYHWNPTDQTLVWDRLPMTVAFTALTVAFLAEMLEPKLERLLLLPALALGIASVWCWQRFGDVRFYYWVQSLPILVLPAITFLTPTTRGRRILVIAALGLYCGAKWAEANDSALFASLGGALSGHTLKHLLAAAGCGALLVLFTRRESARYGEAVARPTALAPSPATAEMPQ